MLSKSAARTFFVAGTGVCAAAFLGLTFDTLAKVPERSKADQMTESVRRGHDLWNDNNCMGCHTLLGEGAYYAPELTQVVNRRGAAWIKTFLKDPEAMFPGKRKMVRYDFTDQDRDDLVAFFTWVGGIDTNGFPPAPVYRVTGGPAVAAAPMKGTPPPTFEQVCVACHALGGKGGAVGPALDGVASRYTTEKLHTWLADPQAVKPGTAMPNLGLSEADRGALVDFLMLQK